MCFWLPRTSCVILILLAVSSPAVALTTVFTEDFSDAANWLTAGYSTLTEVPSGGPDASSYVSLEAVFADVGQGTIFRGHGDFDASGDAFVGNWIDAEYVELSMQVRHDAPEPLTFYVRLATPRNFPAATVQSPLPVEPNTWTEVVFNVRRDSPQISNFEGSDYDTIFSDIGNVQLAVDTPAGLENDTRSFTFDLDKVSVMGVPEPSALLLAITGLLAVCGNRRVRRAV